jgi:hypothetical protein
VVKCRNATGVSLKQEMRYVFDQHTEMDRDGIVKGGDGKLLCLRNGKISKRIIWNLVTTPCMDIIEDLRALFHDFHLFTDLAPSFPRGFRPINPPADKKVALVQKATEELSSSEWILEMISGHLSSEWDVIDDCSLHKTILYPN